ncbi:MAG: glycosyltransferase family 2 protein [Parcubacteria group bacterium]
MISIVIPTHNRPESLKKAVESVLAQTYKDIEIIVIDDGIEQRAEDVIKEINDSRITYIQHQISRGGGAGRNTGIKASKGDFIAFLDDDDEWFPEKLEIQMQAFEETPADVGFCFTAVENIYNDCRKATRVSDGIDNYLNLLLEYFSGFLNVTLVIKKSVFDNVGLFDEDFPSHQETDLLIRIMQKYKGLGINKPLVHVNMHKGHSLMIPFRRIKGREMILEKHAELFEARPVSFARQIFGLGLMYRDSGDFKKAQLAFKKAMSMFFRFRYLMHYVSMIFSGKIYSVFKE